MTLHVDCRYRTDEGFKLDVTFDVDDGITALWGPSGAGKTTLLHLIAGLIRPDDGRIVIDDRTLFCSQEQKMVCVATEQRRVGLVFQDNLLFPHLDVASNLRYGLSRNPAPSIAFERVVSVLELDALITRYPVSLSGGEQRRVAVGRALLQSPSVLLLDEPWTGLDDSLKQKVTTLLLRCKEEWNIPLLLASHDAEQVQAMGARRLNLHEGRIQPSVTAA